MRTVATHPDFAAQLIERFRAIDWPYLDAFQLGLKANPRYDLEFALGKLREAERLAIAARGGRVVVTDDRALRATTAEYFAWMAQSVGIHPAWPQHLLTPAEVAAWIAHYQQGIHECNQAGYHLAEVFKGTYLVKGLPQWLADKYNVHSPFYCLIDVAMLCKIRWYARTQSRHHKPHRLALYNQQFAERVLSITPLTNESER